MPATLPVDVATATQKTEHLASLVAVVDVKAVVVTSLASRGQPADVTETVLRIVHALIVLEADAIILHQVVVLLIQNSTLRVRPTVR